MAATAPKSGQAHENPTRVVLEVFGLVLIFLSSLRNQVNRVFGAAIPVGKFRVSRDFPDGTPANSQVQRGTYPRLRPNLNVR